MLEHMLAFTLQDFLQPPVLFVVGIALLTWSVVRMRKKAKRQPFSTDARPQPQHPNAPAPESRTLSATDIRQMAVQLNELMVDMQDTTRRLSAQIDNRTSKLNALLEEADEKIARLERLQRDLGRTADPAPTSRLAAATNLPPQPDPVDPRHRRIYDLADRGHTTREIAQELGAPPGEIELILNLRGRATAQ